MKYQVFHEENIMWSELTRIYVSAHRSWDAGHKISHKKGARSSDHWCLQHPRYIQYQWLKFCFVNKNKNCWNIVKISVSYVFWGLWVTHPSPLPLYLPALECWKQWIFELNQHHVMNVWWSSDKPTEQKWQNWKVWHKKWKPVMVYDKVKGSCRS